MFTEIWSPEGEPDLRAGEDDNLDSGMSNLRGLFIPAKMIRIKKSDHKSSGEDVEKHELSYTTSGNVKWCSQFQK